MDQELLHLNHATRKAIRESRLEQIQFLWKANADVVLPYSIEEPDDEPAEAAGQTADKPAIRLLVGDNSEIWQGELVDSMEGLQCDSDQSASRTRGKKRKPSATATGSSRPFRQSSSDSIPNAQRDESNDGPKRRRRKGRCARDHLSPGMFWQHDSSETTSSGSYSSRSPSTDDSATQPSSHTDADAMDLDE
ncbi:hypothetical protein AtubIFM56815_001870 [Aspergillus tubingensis]|uniref:Uncharacterized protein n=1 Tax=Aspergillus tubingensis TaxID=5068 RepID=A0A9W6AUH1_ASPTU|nr:hypothetical protein AtubIFM56815_001870 [Aspergillus tubingensis]